MKAKQQWNPPDREQWSRDMVEWRRSLHVHPEAGWLEYRTAARVAEALKAYGWEVMTGTQACVSEARMGVPSDPVIRKSEARALVDGVDPAWLERMRGGHTAVVGVLRGAKPGPVIALRFDMDCVEVGESEAEEHAPRRLGFASDEAGLMHACAHDGHVAIGLGVAQELSRCADELAGEIRLLFQPAEEGCRGAASMIAAGWLDDAELLLCGHIGLVCDGLGHIVASTDGFLPTTKIDAVFRGQAAHAGKSPEEGRNALLAACTAALQLHAIGRHSAGATRINVGVLEGGTGRNVIPDEARLKLEVRGENEALNGYMTREAVRILEASAAMHDVACDWETVGQGTDWDGDGRVLVPLIERVCGEIESVRSVIPTRGLGASEDASLMLRHVQRQGGLGAYMLYGSPLPAGHHQPAFDFDERVLPIAAELLVRLVRTAPEWLESHKARPAMDPIEKEERA